MKKKIAIQFLSLILDVYLIRITELLSSTEKKFAGNVYLVYQPWIQHILLGLKLQLKKNRFTHICLELICLLLRGGGPWLLIRHLAPVAGQSSHLTKTQVS